jgi:hypothetical protein
VGPAFVLTGDRACRMEQKAVTLAVIVDLDRERQLPAANRSARRTGQI